MWNIAYMGQFVCKKKALLWIQISLAYLNNQAVVTVLVN